MFPQTSWTLISQIKDAQYRDLAFGQLSERYRKALVIYAGRMCALLNVRQRDPEDIVQDFFLYLMEKSLLQKPVRDDQRRFRNWLLTVFKFFLLNSTKPDRTPGKKAAGAALNENPGGGSPRRARTVSLDQRIDAGIEPGHLATAEHEYERQWALDLFAQVRSLHAQRFGSEPAYEIFVAKLRDGLTIEALCERFGKSKSQVETILKKLTEGFQTILNNLLANEFETPDEHELLLEKKKFAALLREASVRI